MQPTSRHALVTRLLHAGLALAVTLQLLTSLGAAPPAPGRAGDWLFGVHEYVGLAGFALVLGFWAAALLRRRGTAIGLLLPWAARARRAALWADLRAHLSALRALRLPAQGADAPLASAVHGLGLLLMLAMAGSGAAYFALGGGDPDAGGLIGAVMLVHTALANLVWAYLIGHAGAAVLHHVARGMGLGAMWSLRADKAPTR